MVQHLPTSLLQKEPSTGRARIGRLQQNPQVRLETARMHDTNSREGEREREGFVAPHSPSVRPLDCRPFALSDAALIPRLRWARRLSRKMKSAGTASSWTLPCSAGFVYNTPTAGANAQTAEWLDQRTASHENGS